MKHVKVSDLPVTPVNGVMLKCTECRAKWSATRGDYFWLDPDDVMRCCGLPLRLVKSQTVFTEVKA